MDKELEKRGHRFVHYANDCNIYVRLRQVGERVMASVSGFLAWQLKLTVNAGKNTVDRPVAQFFLGFGFIAGRATKQRNAPLAFARFKAQVWQDDRRQFCHRLNATPPTCPASTGTVDVPVEDDSSTGCPLLNRLRAAIEMPDTVPAWTLSGRGADPGKQGMGSMSMNRGKLQGGVSVLNAVQVGAIR